jgi:hypothetical protein
MAFEQYDLAKIQYLNGLSIDATNTHLLTDLATYFMEQYYLTDTNAIKRYGQSPKNSSKTLYGHCFTLFDKIIYA